MTQGIVETARRGVRVRISSRRRQQVSDRIRNGAEGVIPQVCLNPIVTTEADGRILHGSVRVTEDYTVADAVPRIVRPSLGVGMATCR